jgi:hypothetical protein
MTSHLSSLRTSFSSVMYHAERDKGKWIYDERRRGIVE